MDSLVYEMNVEDMPKKENQVSCSYIHPFICALCKLGVNYIPHCSNVLDNYDYARPDYKVNVYVPPSYKEVYTNLFGEMKAGSCKSKKNLTKDLYRSAMFSKLAIELHNLDSVLMYQSIGTTITFYIMTRLNDVFILLELDSITIPTAISKFDSLALHFDSIYNLSYLYRTFCLKTCSTNDIPSLTKTLPYSIVENLTSGPTGSATKKRNHSSSTNTNKRRR
jgi:hypothetical protein